MKRHRQHSGITRCFGATVTCVRCRSSLGDFVSKLPDVFTTFPTSKRFEAENSGMFDKRFLERLPQYRRVIRDAVYVPSKNDLWAAPSHEAVHTIVSTMPYHSVARYVMEHNFFHLFWQMMQAPDAPLPHVMYEDFMKCKTFASLQQPPHEQFALEPDVLRGLLCTAAHHVLCDEHYFPTVALLFQKVEQQQRMGSEVASGWIFCCAAAGRVKEAIRFAKSMSAKELPFDAVVFSLMLHPHADPSRHHSSKDCSLVSAKGFLLQQRLHHRLSLAFKADSVAVHALFSFFTLTQAHVKKWEVLRIAVEEDVTLSERTVDLAVEAFRKERGLRCGPKTMKAMIRTLAKAGRVPQLLFALIRCRKNELLPEFCDLPSTEFSDYDVQYVTSHLRGSRGDERLLRHVIPIVETLMRNDDPKKLSEALDVWSTSRFSLRVSPKEDRGPQAMMPITERNADPGELTVRSTVDTPAISTSPKAPAMETSPASDTTNSAAPSSGALDDARGDADQHTLVTLLRDVAAMDLVTRKRRRERKDAVSNVHRIQANEIFIPASIEGRKLVETQEQQLNEEALLRSVMDMQRRQTEEERLEKRWRNAWINPDLL